MSLKSFKPYTKSSRGTILVDRSNLWKGKPYKPLTSVNNASKGRNIRKWRYKYKINWIICLCNIKLRFHFFS